MELDVDKMDGMLMVKQKKVFCPFCSVGFRSPGGLADHQETPRHRKNWLYHYYQTNKDTLLTSPHELGLVLEALGLAKEENVFSLHDEKGLTLDGTKLRLKY